METIMAGTVSLHCILPVYLHDLQALLVCGAADGGREADQVVQRPVHGQAVILVHLNFCCHPIAWTNPNIKLFLINPIPMSTANFYIPKNFALQTHIDIH